MAFLTLGKLQIAWQANHPLRHLRHQVAVSSARPIAVCCCHFAEYMGSFLLRSPYNKDYNTLVSILGSLYFGDLPHDAWGNAVVLCSNYVVVKCVDPLGP